ncbi:MAG: M28 family peptidase, partial [Armatimonadetes bacterium]|nr:M28 family peptidase [Armatimonadota bacterium]
PTRNVIGLLEGSDPVLKQEYVVVGAHYDHLGLGGAHSLSSDERPAIHHGADDNASGTAGVLELANHFASRRGELRRSLLFMAFSGEEMGLLGSAHWTKNPTVPLERVAAMVNLDMIGRMKGDTVQVLGAGSSPAWKELLEEANRPHRLQLKAGGGGSFGGSDHQSFYARQIPVLFFFTGIHPDYHLPSDTWEKVNADGQSRLLQLVRDATLRIVRLDTRPAFTRTQEEQQAPSPGFRVFLGTIPDYAEEGVGVVLQGVREGSPAAKAGIQAGDTLVELAGKSIRNVQEYTTILGTLKANVEVGVVVLRKGQRLALKITPMARRN